MNVYLGQIILFAGTYAPRNYAFCNGGTLPIRTNTALYSLIGTTYGGDGINTFGLPDLRGRLPVQSGQGPGLSNYSLGQQAGAETVALTASQMPLHAHFANGYANVGSAVSPAGAAWAEGPTGGGGNKPTPSPDQYTTTGANGSMASNALSSAGTTPTQGHANIQPVLGLNYIIALVGTYPTFS